MKLQVLYDLARFFPLMTWSGNAAVLALAISLFTAGFGGVNWSLALMAVAITILLQYVAHPINDVMDFDIDVKANIGGTNRRKVLIAGLANARELKGLSVGILALCAVLALPIIAVLPYALLFVTIGFCGVVSYNLPPLMLSRHPFSEVAVSFVMVVTQIVGLVYIATGGLLVPLAVVFAVPYALMVASFHCSYFAMDFLTDLVGNKNSTVVSYPKTSWCSLYPFLGVPVVVFVMVYTWNTVPMYAAFFLGAGFIALYILGQNVDQLWQGFYRTHGGKVLEQMFDNLAKGIPGVVPIPAATMEVWNKTSTAIRVNLANQMITAIAAGLLAAGTLVVAAVI